MFNRTAVSGIRESHSCGAIYVYLDAQLLEITCTRVEVINQDKKYNLD
jgi:hypothetical protein